MRIISRLAAMHLLGFWLLAGMCDVYAGVLNENHAKNDDGKVIAFTYLDLFAIESFQSRLLVYDSLSRSSRLCFSRESHEPLLKVWDCADELDGSLLQAEVDALVEAVLRKDKDFDKFDLFPILLDYESPDFDLASFLMGSGPERNGMCADSDPFCTSDVYTFPAGVNSGTAEPGPNYGCLTTRPNPVWYHMRILQPGNITIKIQGTRPNGTSLDIDFALWGPFNDQ